MALPHPSTPPSTLHLATVLRAEGASIEVRSAAFGHAAARLAVPGYVPAAGDAVLVAMVDGGPFVIGAVGALRPVVASDGAAAALEEDEAGREVLRLRAPDGTILVEHRPTEGRTVLLGETLSLEASRDLELTAGGDVRVRADGDVALEAGREARLTTGGAAVRVRDDRAQVVAAELGARLDRADLEVAEVNLVAGTLRTVAGRVKRRLDVLETQVGRLVERASESFREVEGLSQHKAGRLRLVAVDVLSALGRSTLLKAREDVKVKGEKIHLG
jgi:hypothetical protein